MPNDRFCSLILFYFSFRLFRLFLNRGATKINLNLFYDLDYIIKCAVDFEQWYFLRANGIQSKQVIENKLRGISNRMLVQIKWRFFDYGNLIRKECNKSLTFIFEGVEKKEQNTHIAKFMVKIWKLVIESGWIYNSMYCEIRPRHPSRKLSFFECCWLFGGHGFCGMLEENVLSSKPQRCTFPQLCTWQLVVHFSLTWLVDGIICHMQSTVYILSHLNSNH